jgi:hypothetical protein
VRRQRPHREDVDVLPRVAEEDLGVEERVQHAVQLRDPAGDRQPVDHAAEADEADPVLLPDVVGHERAGRLDRLVERARLAGPRLGEGVEEDDDVGVPFRVGLVDPGLASARRRTPVHAADPVAGDERPEVCELNPLAARARRLVAGKGPGLERAQQLSQLLPARVDLERPAQVEGLLVDEEAQTVVGPQDYLADEVGAPVLAVQRQLQLTPLARREVHDGRVRRLRLEPLRHVQQDLDACDRSLGVELEPRLDRLALDLPLGPQLEDRAHPRPLVQREPGHQQHRERRRKCRKLRSGEHERREQPRPGERCVRPELGRRGAGHSAAGSGSGSGSAFGVGTWSSRPSTMSSGRRRCTQSSGRSARRWASAGTATAFTSSGMT